VKAKRQVFIQQNIANPSIRLIAMLFMFALGPLSINIFEKKQYRKQTICKYGDSILFVNQHPGINGIECKVKTFDRFNGRLRCGFLSIKRGVFLLLWGLYLLY
jgi:hypothetical protein